MHFPTVLTAALLSLCAFATSSPLLQTRKTIDPPALYYLRTKVVNGKHVDTGSNKTNLYVYSYHTGAGLGDVGLSPNKSSAMEGYLNGTQQLFTYENNQIGPWPLAIAYGNSYQQWSTATISIAQDPSTYQGFFFNSTGLQYNNSFGGWLACDWWYATPQLFNINAPYTTPLPNSCSRVQLLPVAV